MRRAKPSPRQTAIHEAGHAVMAYTAKRRLGAMSTVRSGDVLGQLEYRGFTAFPADALDHARTRRKVETEIMIALAGLAAEHLQPQQVNRAGGAADVQRALDIAVAATADPDEAIAFVNWLFVRVRNRLRDPRCSRALDALSSELRRRRSLSGAEVRALLARAFAHGAPVRTRRARSRRRSRRGPR